MRPQHCWTLLYVSVLAALLLSLNADGKFYSSTLCSLSICVGLSFLPLWLWDVFALVRFISAASFPNAALRMDLEKRIKVVGLVKVEVAPYDAFPHACTSINIKLYLLKRTSSEVQIASNRTTCKVWNLIKHEEKSTSASTPVTNWDNFIFPVQI